jgi:RNA polymerase sigma factor (sigma-70 family)
VTATSHAELARVVRDHAGQLAAALVGLIGDFSTAEDLVQDAVVTALQRWPVDGIPDRPDAWLFTVARRRGLDVLRRRSNYRTKLAQLQWPVEQDPDDRLRLMFTCCHPALPRAAQIALTLRVVCGLTTEQIARAFLVPASTVAQRITRAKRKITDAGIPYRIPAADELGSRLTELLAVIYLLFNEGYLSTSEQVHARDLVDDAQWLALLLHRLMPTEPEVGGLLALIQLQRARVSARLLYDMLLHLAPSPVTRLHRAIAVRYTAGPEHAMSELEALSDALDRYHLFHATHAELLRDLGRPEEASAADRRALELTSNPAEQAMLRQRLNWA